MARREDDRTVHIALLAQRERRIVHRKPAPRWNIWRAFKDWFFHEPPTDVLPPPEKRDYHAVRNEYDARYEGDRRVD